MMTSRVRFVPILMILIGLTVAPRESLAQPGPPAGGPSAGTGIAQLIDPAVRLVSEGVAAQPVAGQETGAESGRRDLSLDDAVMLALANNLDIRLERLSPQTFDLAIAAIEGAYQPSVTSGFSNGNRVILPNSQLETRSASTETGSVFWSTGVSQQLPWGGSYTVGFNNQRVDSSSEFTSRNPSYASALSVNVTQPLLRGLRIDETRALLETAKIDLDISEIQLDATIINTVANVRNAYWDYVFASQSLEVSRESLALAEQLVADNRERVNIGTIAPIEVVQSQAEVATRSQILAQAEALARTTELTLKMLLVGGTDDPLWRQTIEPTDRPGFQEVAIDIDTAVRTALEQRADLRQARQQLASNAISIRRLRNNTLPALDLGVSYGLSGLGGPEVIRSGLGGAISTTLPGGYGQALQNIGSFDAPNWTVGLNVSYPLGQNPAEATLARARLQQEQTQAQVRQLELRVAAEVTNAALQVQSNRQRVETSGTARDLAQQRLEAVESMFEVGRTDNYFVVQAQRDLRSAQTIELQALLDYQKSLVNYERVQQTGFGGGGIMAIGGGGF